MKALASIDDPGKLLLERRPVRRQTVYMTIASVALLGLLNVMVLGAIHIQDLNVRITPAHVLAFNGAGVGLIIVLMLLHATRYVVRFHERGVERRGWFRRRAVRYDEVEALVYQATRLFTNGVYGGTRLRMVLTTAPGPGQRSIRYDDIVQEPCRPFSLLARQFLGHEDLDDVRDFVANLIADRAFPRIMAGEYFDWGNAGRIHRHGLDIRRRSLLGGKTEVTLDWPAVSQVQVHQGELRLFTDGDRRPRFRLKSDAVNFFPGLLLMTRFCPQRAPEAFDFSDVQHGTAAI